MALDGKRIWCKKITDERITDLCFNCSGSVFAYGTENGHIGFIDYKTKKPIIENFNSKTSEITALQFISDDVIFGFSINC